MTLMSGATSAVDRIRAERVVAMLRPVPDVDDVLAALAGAALMVTGGVNLSNAREFLDAGAVAVGVGSALTGATDLEAEARRLVAALSTA